MIVWWEIETVHHVFAPFSRGLSRAASACLILLLAACAGNVSPEAYSRLTESLLSKGYLRVDPSPADAPYDAAGLAKDFQDVTFSYEFQFDGDRVVRQRLEKPLKRWSGEIRYKLAGDAVTADDAREVAALTTRIGELTGLRFVRTYDRHDMLISIASPSGRDEISRHLAEQDMPEYQQRYDIWRRTPGWLCGVTLSASKADPGRLVFAHIFIGSEVTGLLRKSCLQEEITQSLGLTNDSDRARPSIFNDDQEFAVVTEHDEMLLRLLYDPRLRTGMSAEEAMPIAREILDDLQGRHTQL